MGGGVTTSRNESNRHSGAMQSIEPQMCNCTSGNLEIPGPTDHPGMTSLLPAPHRRHQHLVAAAGAAVDLLAGAELQVLAQADPHFAEPLAVAGGRNRRRAQPRIDLDEGGFE